MHTQQSAFLRVLSVLFVPLGLVAQQTTQLEVFGGYSYLQQSAEPDILLKSAALNGWNASLKLNVTPRLGLLADFSGHYGQRGLTPYTINGLTMPDEPVLVQGSPGAVRQHTFLLGPEVRLLRHGRLTGNVRALVGVAHRNTLVVPVQPLPDTSALPFTERTFPSTSKFAASFGGSIDYRITNRLSYRLLQPELLLTRSESLNQYSLRLSTGLVFGWGGPESNRPPGPPDQATRRRFSFGILGGAALVDAFDHDSAGFIFLPDGSTQTIHSRSYSTLKDYAIGPMIEVELPWSGLAMEFDALYRPMNLTMAGVDPDGSLNSVSPATVVTWELPVLAKYRFRSGRLKPFVELGPSFRTSGNLNAASPSPYGGTAGLGGEVRIGKLRMGPVLRYTHWAGDADYATSRSKRNQVELLLGIAF